MRALGLPESAHKVCVCSVLHEAPLIRDLSYRPVAAGDTNPISPPLQLGATFCLHFSVRTCKHSKFSWHEYMCMLTACVCSVLHEVPLIRDSMKDAAL